MGLGITQNENGEGLQSLVYQNAKTNNAINSHGGMGTTVAN